MTKLNSVELEKKNFEIEIFRIGRKYKIKSFDELWQKLENCEVSESECYDDLIELEYLENNLEKLNAPKS